MKMSETNAQKCQHCVAFSHQTHTEINKETGKMIIMLIPVCKHILIKTE